MPEFVLQVSHIDQQRERDCWFAAAQMLVGWHRARYGRRPQLKDPSEVRELVALRHGPAACCRQP